jgi:hypothetical protein
MQQFSSVSRLIGFSRPPFGAKRTGRDLAVFS